MHRTELILPIIPITTSVVTSGISAISQEEASTVSEIATLVIVTTVTPTTISVTSEEVSSPSPTANLITVLVTLVTTLHVKDNSKNIRWREEEEEEEEEDPSVIVVTHVESIARVVVSILITNLRLSPPIPFLLHLLIPAVPGPVPVQLAGEIPVSPTPPEE